MHVNQFALTLVEPLRNIHNLECKELKEAAVQIVHTIWAEEYLCIYKCTRNATGEIGH